MIPGWPVTKLALAMVIVAGCLRYAALVVCSFGVGLPMIEDRLKYDCV
jgi:hypothetical protein